MNKRLCKKRAIKRYKDDYRGCTHLVGNKGYDIFELTALEDNRCHIFVGQAGVVIFDTIIPVEALTLLMLENHFTYGTFKEFLGQSKNLSEDYKKELLRKCP